MNPAPQSDRIANLHLSAERRAAFISEGYTMLGPVLSARQLAELCTAEAHLRATRREHDAANPLTIFRHQVAPQVPAIREFATSGPHLTVLHDLIGANLVFWYTQFVTKLPDGGRGTATFPWHQDNGYGPLDPATNLTLWIALDDVDERNGCVWVMPGSHRNGVLPHKAVSAESWHLETPVEGNGVPAILRAGEGVLFSGLTLHRSLANATDRPRRGFFLQYADADALHVHDGKPIVGRQHAWVVSGVSQHWTG